MNFERDLLSMLQRQIVDRGINDPAILEAMQRAPRHLFVPHDRMDEAYKDNPIQLPEDFATISQPYMVAYMTQALALTLADKVLEIGTGSGYQTAVLSYLCKEVCTVERHYTLSLNAQRTLEALSRNNIVYKTGDGTQGWQEHAPFNKIIVTAASKEVPPALVDQLADGGTLLIPIGEPQIQTLMRIQKRGDKTLTEQLISCVFVPLVPQSKDSSASGNSGA